MADTHRQNENHRCISHGSLWHCTCSFCTGGKQDHSLGVQRHIKQDRWIYRTSTKCALTIYAIISSTPTPPIIINEVTPRSHNKDPENCLLPKERNPARKNSQQVLIFCTFYISPPNRESREVFGGPPTPLILIIFNPCSADINHIDGKTKLNVKWQSHRIKHQQQTLPSLRIFPLMTEVKNVCSGSKQ